ncbi:MAG: DUF3179 domain-containing protein [Planctomycetota bacterium]|nr:DUF3179 domain-containing protein [Planctomycetota bacterium]
MNRVAALVLLVLLLAGCGEDAPTPQAPGSDGGSPEKAPVDPPAQEPARSAKPKDDAGASAFQLPTWPDKVRHTLDMELFKKGVPRPDPRDAIPALLAPKFVAAKDVTFMRPERRVITMRVGDEIRAYPLHILDRHELVNDEISGKAVLITWCPLCGSSMVYDRVVGGKTLTFGVSGYLYKSDVLMYDHQTESFWSQLEPRAVAGPMTGTDLTVLPSRVTSFGAFRKQNPNAKVLSDDQGIVPPHEYLRQVYLNYDKNPNIWFPVGKQSNALHPKAEVIGVVVNGKKRAYAMSALRMIRDTWDDTVGGEMIMLRYEREGDTVSVWNGGAEMPHVRLFWFAWWAFHPDTDLRAAIGANVIEKPGEVEKPR